MLNHLRSVLRASALRVLCAAAPAADGPARRLGNTRFHLAGFVDAVDRQLPRFGYSDGGRWSAADVSFGHAGNHLAYLSARWQAAKLLPALDPSVDLEALLARWARTCKES